MGSWETNKQSVYKELHGGVGEVHLWGCVCETKWRGRDSPGNGQYHPRGGAPELPLSLFPGPLTLEKGTFGQLLTAPTFPCMLECLFRPGTKNKPLFLKPSHIASQGGDGQGTTDQTEKQELQLYALQSWAPALIAPGEEPRASAKMLELPSALRTS